MKVLVAGAAGFIGSHLTDRLLKDGHEVIGLDNLYTGRYVNLKEAIDCERFTFIQHDITKPLPLRELRGVQWIFNFACPASPPHYQKNPIFTLDTNYFGTKNLCELAVTNGARILQASTSEVYGDPIVHPQIESYWGNVNCFGRRSCYDEGKRVAETLLLEYNRMFGIEIKVIRIFNTYGPRMDPQDGRVVSNVITQALSNKPITIYGDGNQTRSFCYVSDLVEGILSMMLSDKLFIGPVNLGNPNEFTISEVVRIVAELVGSQPLLEFVSLPEDDPKRRKPDISLARAKLGWQPVVDFKKGASKTINYFMNIDG